MKKNILFLFVSIFFLSNCSKKNDITRNDLTIRNLKGSVKYIEEYSYEFDSLKDKSKTIKGEFPNFIFGYDLIKMKFDTAGKIQNHTSIQYLGLNNLNKKEILSEYTKYFYNLYGDKTEIISKFDTLSNDIHTKTVINYESMHRILEVTSRSYFPLIKYYYTSDLNKNVIKEQIAYDIYDRKSERHLFKYGKNDSISEYEIYDYGRKNITLKEIYKYDDSNNLILKEVPIADKAYKKTGIYKYNYNDKNDLVEEIYCFSLLDGIAGKIEINPNYQFDDQMCEKIIYKYDYDKMGNWIKKIKIEKKGITQVYDRKIEYY